jgi:hypothetical protein
MPIGMSLAITFQVALEASRACFSQRSWRGPMKAASGVSVGWRFVPLGPR